MEKQQQVISCHFSKLVSLTEIQKLETEVHLRLQERTFKPNVEAVAELVHKLEISIIQTNNKLSVAYPSCSSKATSRIEISKARWEMFCAWQ